MVIQALSPLRTGTEIWYQKWGSSLLFGVALGKFLVSALRALENVSLKWEQASWNARFVFLELLRAL